MSKQDSYRYKAFISYRHCDGDREWAKWIHSSLESLVIPKHIRIKYGHENKKLGRLFRDEEELPASSNLSDSITDALRESEFLIVICSPNLPESKWCNAEISQFRNLGRPDNIVALLIDGEPEESFPKELTSYTKIVNEESGEQVKKHIDLEPLAADVRPRVGETNKNLKYRAKMRLASVLLGCEFDELIQRDRQRQKKKAGIYYAVACLVMLSLAFLGVRQLRIEEEVRVRETRFAIEELNKAVKNKRYDSAKVLSLEIGQSGFEHGSNFTDPIIAALKHDRLLGYLWSHKQKQSDSSAFDLPSVSFTASDDLIVDSSTSNWWIPVKLDDQKETPESSIQYFDYPSLDSITSLAEPIEKPIAIYNAYFLDFGRERASSYSSDEQEYIGHNSSEYDLFARKGTSNYTWQSSNRIDVAWIIEFPIVLIIDDDDNLALVNMETGQSEEVSTFLGFYGERKLRLFRPLKGSHLLAIFQSQEGFFTLEIDTQFANPLKHYNISYSSDEIVDISISPSGKRLAILNKNQVIDIHSLESKMIQTSISLSQYYINEMIFNSNETLLAVSGLLAPKLSNGTTYFVSSIWDIAENTIVDKNDLSQYKAFSTDTYPNAEQLISPNGDLAIDIRLYEYAQRQLLEHVNDTLPPGRKCLTESEQFEFLSRQAEEGDWTPQKCIN